MRKSSRQYLELAIWIGALMLLALMNPAVSSHYSLCIFKIAGIEFCPGCGLGHSISYLLHGDLQNSFHAHPLGLFALLVIFRRVCQLISSYTIFHFNKHNYGQ